MNALFPTVFCKSKIILEIYLELAGNSDEASVLGGANGLGFTVT